jgi:small conductance mechanosensitive channel
MLEQPVIEETVDQGLAGVQETALRSINRLMNGDPTVVSELIVAYLLPASVALLAVFIGYLVAKYLSRIVSGPICKRIDETLGKFIGRVIFYGVLLTVMGTVLSQIGFKMSGIATILAAAGFAIGLAFQGTLSNFAAGVLLLVFRPFKVGDMINAAGVTGRVNEIDLFTTTLDTPDFRRIIVPNSSISGGTIENISFHAHRRVEVIVGVAYSSDLDATRQALTAAAESLAEKTIQGEGRGYNVILATLADSSVQWKVRVWTAATDFFAVTELLTQAVKVQLDAANISIPFPQMDVHLHRVDAGKENLSETRTRPRMNLAARHYHRDAA